MKLKLTLTLLCLFGIGMFARSQGTKKQKPKVEDAGEVVPVIVHSNKKSHLQPPPPAPPLDQDGKPLPPPKMTKVRFNKPEKQFDKHGNPLPPPPPPPIDKNGKPLPPPKVETQKFGPGELPPPPPPPAKPRKSKPAPITPETQPLEPDQA